MEVVYFIWDRASAEHFDLPIIIDEDIAGVYITNFPFNFFKFVCRSDHAV